MMGTETNDPGGPDMADEPKFQETKDGEPNIHPEHLAEPESLKDVARDVIAGLVDFGEGKPPKGAPDEGHVEGGGEAP
jgi:hypothetical protein